MSIASRLVATSRAVACVISMTHRSRAVHAGASSVRENNTKVWQVGEAGPSTWQNENVLLARPGAAQAGTTLTPDALASSDGAIVSAGSPTTASSASPDASKPFHRKPKTLPASAKALLDALDSDSPPSYVELRDWVRKSRKTSQRAYMLSYICRHLSHQLRVYAAAGHDQRSPWNPFRHALFQLLLEEGAHIPKWRDDQGRLQRHHPAVAVLNTLARNFKYDSTSYPHHSRNAAVLLESLCRQIPSSVRFAPATILSILPLVPPSSEYHLVRASLLSALLASHSSDTHSADEGVSEEQLLQVRKAITMCTPKGEWKSVPDSLHQSLLQAWKVIIDHPSELESLNLQTSDDFTPAFMSLLIKIPGNETMHLPDLINAMGARDLPITPAQTQLVLRYETFLAPWLKTSDSTEIMERVWEGLLVRRQMHAAVMSHTTGVGADIRSLNLAWGEIVLSSYEVIHALSRHEDAASLHVQVNVKEEEDFWVEQLATHEQRWRTTIEEALQGSDDQSTADDFAPANKQGQALWLLLRHRLLFGRLVPPSSDQLKDPRFLFRLSIGSGKRTKMQHIRVVSCLIRLLLHYRNDIIQLIPCLQEVAVDKTIKLPSLLYQRLMTLCKTRRHLRDMLPTLLEMPAPREPVVMVSKELRRVVCLAADCGDEAQLFLRLLDHWRVECPVGKVGEILHKHRARANLVDVAAKWEASRVVHAA